MAAVIAGRALDGERIADAVATARRRCRDAFRRTDLLSQLIPAIEDVLSAGGLEVPAVPDEGQPIAIPNPDPSGDAGHRG
jgi:CRISPR-associated protein Cas1